MKFLPTGELPLLFSHFSYALASLRFDEKEYRLLMVNEGEVTDVLTPRPLAR